jgi:putative transcriptional regulator
MKTVRSNLLVLLAEKQQREQRRISLRKVSMETGLRPYTVYSFANNSLKEYPGEAIARLCEYFSCDTGDLLKLVDEA